MDDLDLQIANLETYLQLLYENKFNETNPEHVEAMREELKRLYVARMNRNYNKN